MAWFPIGPSSYPTHKGSIQYVNSKRIADQFLSLKRDFDAMKAAAGSEDRLSPNEAKRSRADQDRLYADYVSGRSSVLAAVPYTSRHDEVTHGNAIDVGVTMGNGDNRALTPTEFAWMHDQCERRGFTWTGRYFAVVEPWHIEGATRAEILPPYPDIIAGGDDVVISAPPTTTPVGDPVNTRIKRVKYPNVEFRSYLVNAEEFKAMPLVTKDQETYWNNAGIPLDKDVQPAWILTNFEIVTGKGVY